MTMKIVGIDVTFDLGVGAGIVVKQMTMEMKKSVAAFEIFGN